MSNAVLMARALANTTDFDTNLAAQEAVDALAHEAEVEARLDPGYKKWLVEYKVAEWRHGRYGSYQKWATYCDKVEAKTAEDAVSEAIWEFGEGRDCKVLTVWEGDGGKPVLRFPRR